MGRRLGLREHVVDLRIGFEHACVLGSVTRERSSVVVLDDEMRRPHQRHVVDGRADRRLEGRRVVGLPCAYDLAVESEPAEYLFWPIALKSLTLLQIAVGGDESVERRRLGGIRYRHICALPAHGELHHGVVCDHLRPRMPCDRAGDRLHVLGRVFERRIEDDD